MITTPFDCPSFLSSFRTTNDCYYHASYHVSFDAQPLSFQFLKATRDSEFPPISDSLNFNTLSIDCDDDNYSKGAK